MMLTGRRTSLLLAFFPLTSAATAHAECAWVLWEKGTYASEHARQVNKTGDAPYIVWAVLRDRQKADVLTDITEGIVVEGRTITRTWKTGGYSSWEYECLPDTIDPRGPKGK
jgi:hypothetical protein